MKKTGFTYEQHETLGLELLTMRNRLHKIHTELASAYPHRFADKAAATWKSIDSLRTALENKVCQENPDIPDAYQVYLNKAEPHTDPQA